MSIINSAYSALLKQGVLKDPVSMNFALDYQKNRPHDYAKNEVDLIELVGGPVKGKKVVDICGGPGLVSIELARRGAVVTWYDMSKTYELLAKRNFKRAGLEIKTHRGLIDDDYLGSLGKFDLAINLVCWYYSDSDPKMAKFLKNLLKRDGKLYVSCNVGRVSTQYLGRIKSYIYHRYGVKIGHPFPSKGMIKKALERVGFQTLHYSLPKENFEDDVERIYCVLLP